MFVATRYATKKSRVQMFAGTLSLTIGLQRLGETSMTVGNLSLYLY